MIHEAGRAAHLGVRFSAPTIDVGKLRAWKEGVVDKLTGGLGQLCRQRKVDYLRGRARFADGRTLEVEAEEGERRKLGFDHAIIATGSRPDVLLGFPPGSTSVWDSTAALELREIPERLLVVGGGYIGLELGSVYAALGSHVTVVELCSGLLPGVDRDLVGPLEVRLKSEFEEILLETRVAGVREADCGLHVRFEGRGAGREERRFDRILVSVGRRPNSADLGLDTTEVRIDEAGYIAVDSQMRTAEPSIFAIGDVVGQPMLAHRLLRAEHPPAPAAAGGGTRGERHYSSEPSDSPLKISIPGMACFSSAMPSADTLHLRT